MRKILPAFVGIAVVFVLAAVSLEEQKPPAREYVGSKMCRICHNAPAKGKMHDIWSKTKHAQAHQTLLTAEAKQAAKKLSIAEPAKSGICLRCHATAYGFTKDMVTKKVTAEEGVGCESCHGAGKDFAKLDVMNVREKAIAAGLVYPAKDICTKCHNAESPTWNPERYTDKNANKTGFDFDVLWKMIEHYLPKKEEG